MAFDISKNEDREPSPVFHRGEIMPKKKKLFLNIFAVLFCLIFIAVAIVLIFGNDTKKILQLQKKTGC